MRLTKKVELGIKAINALKKYHTPVRAQDLATEIAESFHFLEQVLRKLRIAGIVTVKRGPGGGYFLAKTDSFTAYDVATALGREFGDTLSLSDAPTDRLAKAVTEAYQKTTI